MEAAAIQQPAAASVSTGSAAAGTDRAEALAARRREAVADSAASAEAARGRATEALAATREAIARAIGANTRLSIASADGPGAFVYRAIDVETGEVVHEWPEGAFLQLLRGVRDDVQTDVDAGLILDEQA